MVEMSGIYQGLKHCELTHGPSGALIATDAPKDNNGKGEAFSPTDLVAVATGSCMITVLAIHAEKAGLSMQDASFKVSKHMQSEPRQIQKISISLHLPKDIPLEKRNSLESLALNCPVKRSLREDIEIPVQFHYDV